MDRTEGGQEDRAITFSRASADTLGILLVRRRVSHHNRLRNKRHPATTKTMSPTNQTTSDRFVAPRRYNVYVMIAARAGAFVLGLVAGYVGSGIVLGPGVLAVMCGVVLGAVLAYVLPWRERDL